METNFQKKALLALEDGALFYGRTNCENTLLCAEVVFTTAMTGYQEVCTDPSYSHQMVVFTTSHVGNVGTNAYDYESEKIGVKGILVREMTHTSRHFRNEEDFPAFLKRHHVPWIEGIDTRRLTRHLRDQGSKKGCIMIGDIDAALAIQLAKAHILENHSFPACGYEPRSFSSSRKEKKLIYVYDFGVKISLLQMLSHPDCEIHRIPSSFAISECLGDQPDAIVISNGPGDPAAMQENIAQIKPLLTSGIPILGICLGCQLIALAAGGSTKKMKFGQHGTNHPVYSYQKKKVSMTSQNHNYVIDEKTLPSDFIVTHRSLFDGTIQGIQSKNFPVVGFQGHPEGSPGPQDIVEIIEEFLDEVRKKHALTAKY